MADAPLTSDDFRTSDAAFRRLARGDLQSVRECVSAVLLAQATERATTRSPDSIDQQMRARDLAAGAGAIGEVRPLEALRSANPTPVERAAWSVLLAQHVGELLEGERGTEIVRDHAPALDWLEIHGVAAPYSAARTILAAPTLVRLNDALADASLDAGSERATAALRSLRNLVSMEAATRASRVVRSAAEERATESASVAGELEGLHRSRLHRTIAILTGYAALRGVVLLLGRHVFSFKRPITVRVEGPHLRIAGHAEILGRTLRTFDVRYPVAELVEIRRETRYPALPAAVSVVALGLGAFFGARSVVEGAGVSYFPLIGVGIALLVGGVFVDVLLRALFPGLRGECRLEVRSRDATGVVLTRLALDELDALLARIDRALEPGHDRSITAPPGPTLKDPPRSSELQSTTS